MKSNIKIHETKIYVTIYLFAIVVSNQLITLFGPSLIPWLAFFIIPIDFIVRDFLHDKWENDNLWLKMFSLIIAGSALSFILNQNSLNIGLASCIAFLNAGIIDTIIYQKLKGFIRSFRINVSNFFSVIVDSVLFPYIAFGLLDSNLIGKQIIMKVLGSLIWTFLIIKVLKHRSNGNNLKGL